MPVVAIPKADLMAALGEEFTDSQFEDLCFEFGIELDDVTTEATMLRKERGVEGDPSTLVGVSETSNEIIYKIEVPANRYDLLCLEGLAAALRVFRGRDSPPALTIDPPRGEPIVITVHPDTARIRPHIVSAVLRDVTFDEKNYNRFIEFQDKLHQNLCRRRTLVAIGTHDLDTIKAPFTYEALAPEEIRFVPLNKTAEMNAAEMMVMYESDLKLRQFLPIIRDSAVYPVIYDANRVVLSMPPIINGNHSRIALRTRNVLIECTATDLTKAVITLNMIVAGFSCYCANKFHIEPVSVVYPDGRSCTYPDLSWNHFRVALADVHRTIGVSDITAADCCALLQRMQLPSEVDPDDASYIRTSAPPTRPDVLHACDVVEDICIAYGYNRVPRTYPKTTTAGKPQPLNKLSDLLRLEMGFAGYTEVLTLALCSRDELYEMLLRPDDGLAITVANPKNTEFQTVRTTLLPGLLRTIAHNRTEPLPLHFFELSDAVVKDAAADVGARNVRKLAAAYVSKASSFETVHGLLDRTMQVVSVEWEPHSDSGFRLAESNEPFLFPGQQAHVVCRGRPIGYVGVVHPLVLRNFGIETPVSVVEIDIEQFV